MVIPSRRLRACRVGASAQALCILLMALLIGGCSRPIDRPLEGARPLQPGETPEAARLAPPVLDPPSALAAAASPSPTSPVPIAVASPVASPSAGRPPVVGGLQPQPDSQIPPGPVTVSVRINAVSDITEVTLQVDGQTARPSAGGADPRSPTYSVTMDLGPGEHEARIQVRDDQGRVGGYRWKFTVQGPPTARPTAVRSPTPRR